MICIYCGHETEVYNSRRMRRNPSVWRRRRCIACVAQFSTEELPDYDVSLVVKGLDGKLYPFSRDKLFLSLHNSLGHRKDALESATQLTATVIGKLLRSKKAPDGVLAIQHLAQAGYLTLKRFDPLAANTYKAYHQAALK
jgi:transcriptional regulator NrdR family protein